MTNTRIIDAQSALIGPDYQRSGPVRFLVRDGVISDMIDLPDGTDIPAHFVMPSLSDAHNHARPLSTTSFGAGFKPLETWLPSLAGMPAVDPYLATLASLARSALGGCSSVMVHLTRPMGQNGIVAEAKDIARAAKEIGIKIGFALSMRDQNPLSYFDIEQSLDTLSAADLEFVKKTWLAPMPDIAQQLSAIDDIAKALEDETHVNVQYGPAGVQWCSNELLKGISDASARTGRRVHMHLLETKPQRVWADETYPDGMVAFLDDIGFLSDRLTLAHCVWVTADDMRLMGQRDVTVSVNPSSNLHLASGIADAAHMADHGIQIAMGLDGCALDEDDDGLREMRLYRLLNQGWAFQERLTPTHILKAVCRTGRESMGFKGGGYLDIGMPADLMVMDLKALDRDAVMAVDPLHYIFTRANMNHILELMCEGQTIVKNGALPNIDMHAIHEELRAQYRQKITQSKRFFEVWPKLEPMLKTHYQSHAGCC